MPIPTLSFMEAQVLQNKDFFLTKASIDAKISDLFEALKHEIESKLQTKPLNWPHGLQTQPSRVYRGENLGHLPWRALDCPRYFVGTDMLTFRCLLVWGNSFSFHLLLGGIWHQRLSSILLSNLQSRPNSAWLFSLQETPWDWEMQLQQYISLDNRPLTEFQTITQAKGWLKLSLSYPLEAFDNIPKLGSMHFAEILDALI